MSYIGRSARFGIFDKQTLIPDSSETDFNLNYVVSSATSILVVYGGAVLEPNEDYTIGNNGNEINFGVAPTTGTSLYIIYLGNPISINLNYLSSSHAYSVSSLANGANNKTTYTISGVSVGDIIHATLDTNPGVMLYAYASATNEVKVVLLNTSGGSQTITGNIFIDIKKR